MINSTKVRYYFQKRKRRKADYQKQNNITI